MPPPPSPSAPTPAAPWPAAPWPGRLLVATPTLLDPQFFRAVVLLLTHEESEGALGVVLTRPTATEVGEVLPMWSGLAAGPPLVFEGGPVQPAAAVCLGRVRSPERPGLGWAPLTDPLMGTVDLERPPSEALLTVRVFAGYAGWSAGQLEAEVEEGAWWVLDALPGDPFAARPELLWRQVLRRQGPPLAFAAGYPPDPTLN